MSLVRRCQRWQEAATAANKRGETCWKRKARRHKWRGQRTFIFKIQSQRCLKSSDLLSGFTWQQWLPSNNSPVIANYLSCIPFDFPPLMIKAGALDALPPSFKQTRWFLWSGVAMASVCHRSLVVLDASRGPSRVWAWRLQPVGDLFFRNTFLLQKASLENTTRTLWRISAQCCRSAGGRA